MIYYILSIFTDKHSDAIHMAKRFIVSRIPILNYCLKINLLTEEELQSLWSKVRKKVNLFINSKR